MKYLAILVMLSGFAHAQVKIDQVTITKPSETNTINKNTANKFITPVKGWNRIQGKIISSQNLKNIDGITEVNIIDTQKNKQVLNISFRTNKLPASYYIQYNPIKMKEKEYFIQAVIKNNYGKILYKSEKIAIKKASFENINMSVK